jgi:LacI family transcriptional regulator
LKTKQETLQRNFVSDRLKRDLIYQIENNILKPGNAILSGPALARKYGISYVTVIKVINELVDKGFLYSNRGKGTFVADLKGSMRKDRYSRVDSKTRFLLGVVIPNLSNRFFTEIIHGVEATANKNKYEIILCNAEDDPDKEEKYMRRLYERGARGLVFVTHKDSHLNRFALELSKKLPIVVVNVFIDRIKANFVASDDMRGAYEAVNHLIELGHKSILHLAGPLQTSTAKVRLDGYKNALSEHNINFDQDLVRETDWKRHSGYQEMKKFLIKEGKKITAVFACNDTVASGAFKAIKDLGLNIPKDIAIVGFGNLEIAQLLDVPLTTVDQSSYQMGTVATRILVEKISAKGKAKSLRKEIIPTKLIVRESCGVNLVKPVHL